MSEDTNATPPVTGGEVEAPETEATNAEAPEGQNSFSKDQVDDLLNALRSERTARRSNEKQLKELGAQLDQLKGIDPEQYAKLQAEAAKRAELESALKDQIGSIEKNYAEQLHAAEEAKKEANTQVLDLQKRYAFEQALAAAGGRGGKWTATVYAEVQDSIRLEDDGTITVVDKSGAYILEDGKRVEPSDWLKQFKADEFLGYAFKPERGAGSGLMEMPGTRIGNSGDIHNMTKEELFAHAFKVKK